MIARLIPLLLLALHAALLAWALLGLAEYIVAAPPWPPLANPLFPAWLQLVQWLVVLAASTLFLAGYALRWPGLPRAMIAAYGTMAIVCALQTTSYLEHPGRYFDLAIEYGAYLLVLVWLFRAPAARRRFTDRRCSAAAFR